MSETAKPRGDHMIPALDALTLRYRDREREAYDDGDEAEAGEYRSMAEMLDTFRSALQAEVGRRTEAESALSASQAESARLRGILEAAAKNFDAVANGLPEEDFPESRDLIFRAAALTRSALRETGKP